MADIFSIHQLLTSEISTVSTGPDDGLRDILRELGSVKNNENELMGVSSAEISLTLTPKLHNAQGMLGVAMRCTCDTTDTPGGQILTRR